MEPLKIALKKFQWSQMTSSMNNCNSRSSNKNFKWNKYFKFKSKMKKTLNIKDKIRRVLIIIAAVNYNQSLLVIKLLILIII